MFRRCALRFPRAEYRPNTAYEEFFGYSGAKRNAAIMVVFGSGLYFILMRLALQSISTAPAELTSTEQQLTDANTTVRALSEREQLIVQQARREREAREARRQ